MNKQEACTFCDLLQSKKENIIKEDEYCCAFFDKHPFTQGHILVISKTHYTNINTAPVRISASIFKFCNSLIKILQSIDGCKGVSIYQNNTPFTNSHVNHLHFHVVPFFEDEDIKIPRLSQDQINLNTRDIISNKLGEIEKSIIFKSEASDPEIISWINMVNRNLFDNPDNLMARTSKLGIDALEIWKQKIHHGEDIIAIAALKDEVVAGAHLSRNKDKKNHTGKISLLVDENYRNQGIGKRLIKDLITKSLTKGVKRFEVEPSIENLTAINLFVHLGFKIEGILYSKLQVSSNKYIDCISMSRIYL